MTMPAGTYVISDLCYVMHDEWTECCDLFFAGRDDHNCNEGEFELSDGRRFANFNTTYGDGTYDASNGAELSVDSGSIGIIKLEDIDQTNPENHVDYGTIVEFEHPFTVYKHQGVMHFGHISVDTDPEYEEDEDYYDDEDDA